MPQTRLTDRATVNRKQKKAAEVKDLKEDLHRGPSGRLPALARRVCRHLLRLGHPRRAGRPPTEDGEEVLVMGTMAECVDVAESVVETGQHTNDNIEEVPATMHVTLVWRPEVAIVPGSSWRIHHLGDAIEPDLLPRTAAGTDPRMQR